MTNFRGPAPMPAEERKIYNAGFHMAMKMVAECRPRQGHKLALDVLEEFGKREEETNDN